MGNNTLPCLEHMGDPFPRVFEQSHGVDFLEGEGL